VTRRAGLAPLWIVSLAPAALAACAGPRIADYAERPGPYDALSPVELQVLADARKSAAGGDRDLARRRLETLCAALPNNLVAATALQEVELAILAAGGDLPSLAPEAADGSPIARLYPRYAGRAETYGTAAADVLAARLAPDAATADAWIERALDADPACVWAHYARAFTLAGAQRFEPARASLSAALALDPGHPPSRRLEAELLTRRGDVELAIEAWRAWLTRYGADPRLPAASEAHAHLELATLLAQAGDAAGALAALDALEPGLLQDPTDAALVRVVALDALGRVDEALEVAREAAARAPGDTRPHVQQALLLGDRRRDPAGARAAWEEVLRLLDAPASASHGAANGGSAAGELTALFLRLQANAALARLDAAGHEGPGK
jgi:Tfp pilus assembly protein PilF